MFLTLLVYFCCQVFIVILIVMWDPTDKNTTDVLKLTYHYCILADHLAQKPDDVFVN
jgi:hypothetical protein